MNFETITTELGEQIAKLQTTFDEYASLLLNVTDLITMEALLGHRTELESIRCTFDRHCTGLRDVHFMFARDEKPERWTIATPPAETSVSACTDMPIQPIAVRAWDVGWLKTLISSYQREHDFDADEDSGATQEMLSACEALHALLAKHFPACAHHEIENATMLAAGKFLCDKCYAELRQLNGDKGDKDEIPF